MGFFNALLKYIRRLFKKKKDPEEKDFFFYTGFDGKPYDIKIVNNTEIFTTRRTLLVDQDNIYLSIPLVDRIYLAQCNGYNSVEDFVEHIKKTHGFPYKAPIECWENKPGSRLQ